MKYELISRAYKAISKIATKDMKLKTSYDIYKLSKALKEYISFEQEKTQELFNKYNIQLDSSGSFSFNDQDKANAFIKEYNSTISELYNMDINIEFDKITIDINDNFELSPSNIEALEPFINFG